MPVILKSAPPVPAVPTVTVPPESWNVPSPAKPLPLGVVKLPPETLNAPGELIVVSVAPDTVVVPPVWVY